MHRMTVCLDAIAPTHLTALHEPLRPLRPQVRCASLGTPPLPLQGGPKS